MELKLLLTKMAAEPSVPLARVQVLRSKAVFLTKLAERLNVPIPQNLFDEGTHRDSYYFHMGFIAGAWRSFEEIPDAFIEDALKPLKEPDKKIIGLLLGKEKL